MTTKTPSTSNAFNRQLSLFHHKIANVMSLNCKLPDLYMFLYELNFEDELCSVRLQPVGKSFNLNHLNDVSVVLEKIFAEHLDAAIQFDPNQTQLLFDGMYEDYSVYLQLHFKVGKWAEFKRIQKLHKAAKEEEEAKQAVKREAQRVRDQARKAKSAEAQEKQERKLFEKLKKKFGDKS